MQARGGCVPLTIDSAEDCSLGDLGDGKPFAVRLDRADIVVFASLRPTEGKELRWN